METFEVSALALPVADGVVHELELRDIAKVRNREHGLEDRLKAAVVALAGQLIHLQEAIVRALLHFNQIGNLNRCWNFAEVKTSATSTVVIVRHYDSWNLLRLRCSAARPCRRIALCATRQLTICFS
jgi:hypothetical protein